jgi:4-hydroxybenzoate polyprenyltransferase
MELLRPPNLPTALGDPVAGYMLAAAGDHSGLPWIRLGAVAVAAVLLYAAGLIWNDIADRGEDGIVRPERPIPSGRIGLPAARTAAVLLAVCALGLAACASPRAGAMAAILAGLALAYNFAARRIAAWLGFLNMGLCRGVSGLMGAALVPPAEWPGSVFWAAGGITLLIASVTAIAARETKAVAVGCVRWLPALLVLGCFTGAFLFGAGITGLALACASTAVGWLGYWGWRLGGTPEPRLAQRAIGAMIRALVPIQAGLCATVPVYGAPVAGCLLLAWPASRLLARRFYAS